MTAWVTTGEIYITSGFCAVGNSRDRSSQILQSIMAKEAENSNKDASSRRLTPQSEISVDSGGELTNKEQAPHSVSLEVKVQARKWHRK